MKYKNLIITSVAIATAGASAFADWNMLYDFEGGQVPAEILSILSLETSNGYTEVENGMLKVAHGSAQESTSNLFVVLPLNMDLRAISESAQGPVTVFFQMKQPTVGDHKAIVDVAWGMINIDPDVVLETKYNSFNAMMRINGGTNGFELRDGGGYTEITQLNADAVYDVWMVLDYSLNFMEVYIKGGQYTEQTYLGAVAYRFNPGEGETVDYMMLALSDGNLEAPKGIDYMLFDNIAVDTSGQTLTVPTVGTQTWGPYPVTQAGDANTGNWLGWVNVTYQPYIWSYSLNKYLYIEESAIGAFGGWVYVPNY